MAITVTPSLPVIAASPVAGGTNSGVVLQAGTVINAQVLQVADNLVQIAIANLAFDVVSEVALTAGQNLQLAVSQTDDGIQLSIVGQGAGAASTSSPAADTVSLSANAPVNPAPAASSAADPLTPLERIAVAAASETAATQQQSLAPLFANLGAAASSDSLPPQLQQAVLQVLAQQTNLDPNLSGSDIQNAFQTSGLFLESALASGVVPPTGGVPDLKAALIVLRQTLVTAVDTVEGPAAVQLQPGATGEPAAAASAKAVSSQAAPTLVPDIEASETLALQGQSQATEDASAGNPVRIVPGAALLNAEPGSVTSGAVLNLLQEALQALPSATANAPATLTPPNGSGENVQAQTATPPPPFRGALPSAQPVASPSIASDASLSTITHRLLDDTDAALARQTLLQVASLPDASGMRADQAASRWNFEIPFATPQGTAMAQFEVSRDGGGNQTEAAKQIWRARFSLDVEPAGPVHALVSFSGDRTSVRMWAERPQTVTQLRASAGELSQALAKAELSPGEIVIREGTPPQPAPAKAGHFLDRAL